MPWYLSERSNTTLLFLVCSGWIRDSANCTMFAREDRCQSPFSSACGRVHNRCMCWSRSCRRLPGLRSWRIFFQGWKNVFELRRNCSEDLDQLFSTAGRICTSYRCVSCSKWIKVDKLFDSYMCSGRLVWKELYSLWSLLPVGPPIHQPKAVI